MAESWQKVNYLAGFQCSSRALASGKAQVLCQQLVYVCNGSEFVYLYNKEEKFLKAVYEFPGKVWHIETVSQQGQLFALCTENGIYSVSEKKHGRPIKDAERSDGNYPPVVYKVSSEDCVISDTTICTFIVAYNFLVTVSNISDRWTIKKYQVVQDQDVNFRFLGEVEFPAVPKPRIESPTKALSFLPSLAFVASCTADAPEEALDNDRSFVLEASLFRLLFGIDAAMLHSPMILCAFPDGRLCCIPQKAVPICVNKTISPEEVKCPSFTQMLLYHLEQPVVYIGPLRPQHTATDSGQQGETSSGLACDGIVALGHQGKFVIITFGVKDGTKVLVFKEHTLDGPIISGFSCLDTLYYSTPFNIFCIHISLDDEKTRNMPSVFPVNLNICSAAAMTVSSRTSGDRICERAIERCYWSQPVTSDAFQLPICSEKADICLIMERLGNVYSHAFPLSDRPEDGELLALSTRGRLMACSLHKNTANRARHLTRPAAIAQEKGQEITEVLSRIAVVSDRVSWLKCAIGQKNKSLSLLNQVINVSCAVLAGQSPRQLVGCLVSAFWSRLLLKDSLIVSCCLENLTDYSLEHGWILCIHVSTSHFNSSADSPSSAAVYHFPINKLLPGKKTEVTFPLPSGQKGSLDLPVNVSCMLFYSLAGITGNDVGAANSQVSHRSTCVDMLRGDAICLPLKEHVIDVLHCLRMHSGKEQGASSSLSQTWSLASDPVETFLSASMKLSEQSFEFEARKKQQDTLSMEQASYISPLVASVRLSLELLKKTLKEDCEGRSLCCAVLQWLLSDISWVDTLEAQRLSGVLCITPDGSDVRLLVSEVTVNDLCPEGPVLAIEIKVESSSTAAIASMHEAVLRRVKNLLIHDAPRSSSRDLQVKHLQQMLTKSEMLLKDVQSLRDQLCLGKDPHASATTERLLNIYRELRNPSLIVL